MVIVSSVLTCFSAFVFVFAFILNTANGADTAAAPSVASVKMTPAEVAKQLEDALKAAQEALKSFYSDDSLTFMNSLLNTAGTLPPWITALATSFGQVPPLFDSQSNPPTPEDLKVLTAAMLKIYSNLRQIKDKYVQLEPEFPYQILLSKFQEQRRALSDTFDQLLRYMELPNSITLIGLVNACTAKDAPQSLIRYIWREIDGGDPEIMDYFRDSCNYTEIILRARTGTGIYMMVAQLVGLCVGAEYADLANPGIRFDAKEIDQNWAKLAAKFHSALTSIKQLKNCLPIFTDEVDFYSKKNKDLGHEQFSTGLASNLLEKFPWINWYVFSYDDGLDEEEHSCIGGILSHCIQRKYGRNLFVAGQQSEGNYFYNKNCPEQKECVAKLDQYKNCADAATPFEDCIKETCKPPAGTLCKKSGDGFAAEKGKTASSDGWNKFKFGTDTKYFMHVVSP